ncbi:DUF2384 domain-containing protein [Vreelandella nanhaiensis]|uniref:DUF2384 domain-containing protein n=2 Tax=Vreelandella nanhaiensis TaxID=1258546 RepID=A0A3S0XWH3_9GAMM|nr:DUF2384 domain-containing protein [Halomonas nanhaiensis]
MGFRLTAQAHIAQQRYYDAFLKGYPASNSFTACSPIANPNAIVAALSQPIPSWVCYLFCYHINKEIPMVSATDCRRDLEKKAAALLGASDNISLDLLIRRGIPLSAIDRVDAYGVNAVELSIISKKALKHRLNQGKPLNPCEGDKLYRAILATLFATSIFGNKQKTDTWLHKPRKAFGGQNALQASATTPGYNCVVTLLERLRHGFAA